MAKHLPFLIPVALLLAASPAPAATLAEALQHWTGVTVDVIGQGERVRVVLPPTSPVPAFTARARQTDRAGEPGWQLTEVMLPVPLHVRGGDTATLETQQAHAWLGARTVDASASYGGVAFVHDRQTTRLDQVAVSVSSLGGPVALAVDLTGLHVSDVASGVATLLPQHVVLRGHTSPAGAMALSSMVGGRPAGAAPITVDQLGFDIGPSHFSAAGTVTLVSPTDRHGQVELSADHFGDLLRRMPMDDATARVYPVLMILRQMGQKRDGRLTWTAVFAGRSILVNGIDIAPLMGL